MVGHPSDPRRDGSEDWQEACLVGRAFLPPNAGGLDPRLLALDKRMTRQALVLRYRTKPGVSGDVQKIWQKHMQQAIAENLGH